LNSQTKPDNLVAIRRNGTRVYTRPEEAGKALFTAMEKDQFEMVEIRGVWVHVLISGDSRGWIRRAQLEFPEDPATASAGGTKPAERFRITREEIGVFSGNWEPLRGKTVKVYSVQPAQSPTLETAAREKRNFVKEVLTRVERAFRNRYGHGWRCRRLRFAGWGPGVGDSRLPGTMATRKTFRTGVLASMFARST